VHERYRQTTDGWATANSERERELTFAKKDTALVPEARYENHKYMTTAYRK